MINGLDTVATELGERKEQPRITRIIRIDAFESIRPTFAWQSFIRVIRVIRGSLARNTQYCCCYVVDAVLCDFSSTLRALRVYVVSSRRPCNLGCRS
jgi:hypothetical protein